MLGEPVPQRQVARAARPVVHQRCRAARRAQRRGKRGKRRRTDASGNEDGAGAGIRRQLETVAQRPEHAQRRTRLERGQQGRPLTDHPVQHLDRVVRRVGEGARQATHAVRAPQQRLASGNADHEELSRFHLGGQLRGTELNEQVAVTEVRVAQDGSRDVSWHERLLYERERIVNAAKTVNGAASRGTRLDGFLRVG